MIIFHKPLAILEALMLRLGVDNYNLRTLRKFVSREHEIKPYLDPYDLP